VAKTGLGWNALDSIKQQLRADSVRWFPGYATGAAAQSLAVLRLYGIAQFNYDPTCDLERIRVPTLVITGENDVAAPIARKVLDQIILGAPAAPGSIAVRPALAPTADQEE